MLPSKQGRKEPHIFFIGFGGGIFPCQCSQNPAVWESLVGVRCTDNGVNRTILSGNRLKEPKEGAGGRGGATQKQDTYFAVDSSSYLVFKSKSSA